MKIKLFNKEKEFEKLEYERERVKMDNVQEVKRLLEKNRFLEQEIEKLVKLNRAQEEEIRAVRDERNRA